MKNYFLVVLLGSLPWVGKSQPTAPVNWEEQKNVRFTVISHGIPAYGKTEGLYKQNGSEKYRITLGEPVVVTVAEKPEGWGFIQFPKLYRSIDGAIVATWAMHTDHAESYGKDSDGFAVSKDGGKTWTFPGGPKPPGDGLLLPNGDIIRNYTPPALDTASLKLPRKVGTVSENYGRTFSYYKLDQLPEKLQGVYLNRLKKGQKEWSLEHSQLLDPTAVRYTDNKLFPLVWWGDMKMESTNDIVTGIYPGFSLENGKVPASGVLFYRSSDQGKTWKAVGKIPYAPDVTQDPNGNKRLALGFTEPAFEILADGSYLCVLRTSDGLGNSPMYVSRSVDKGANWSRPKVFTSSGVLPKLLQLKNGVVALASGRPGMQLRFSNGSKGLQWSDAFEMLPFTDQKDAVSCGYPDLLALGPDKFLLVYSDFKYKNAQGEIRKAIKVREVTVTPR
ncbi:sialidase family protein [Larkinella rosea]|uniref:Exo-alpha-sialidase n=1 Tax=Larkinella rosea TaxID=2025312 RepID=A0A3P1BA86_9BACT|nr:sialidase family protein [Larkinella rosea]RRA98016.1 exo-alpha-sialidase [Larkinella rosea]